MRSTLISPLAIIGLLLLSGCSSPSEDPQPDASGAAESAGQTSAPSEDAAEEPGASEVNESQAPTGSAGEDDAGDDDMAGGNQGLMVTVGSEETAISPTDVYCSGEPGDIHHLIGKTNDRPPLVKVESSDFVMVKTGHGKPFEAKQPKGVSFGDKSVTFDETSLGSAVLNGTMTCTKWED